jgi:hypothetical protein
MAIGDPLGQGTLAFAAGPSIGAERLHPPAIQPGSAARAILVRIEEHLLVVTQEWHQPASCGQIDEPFQYAAAIGTSVDVIAQRDDRILAPRAENLDKTIESGQAAVNVANRQGACGHASSSTDFVKATTLTGNQPAARNHDATVRRLAGDQEHIEKLQGSESAAILPATAPAFAAHVRLPRRREGLACIRKDLLLLEQWAWKALVPLRARRLAALARRRIPMFAELGALLRSIGSAIVSHVCKSGEARAAWRQEQLAPLVPKLREGAIALKRRCGLLVLPYADDDATDLREAGESPSGGWRSGPRLGRNRTLGTPQLLQQPGKSGPHRRRVHQPLTLGFYCDPPLAWLALWT